LPFAGAKLFVSVTATVTRFLATLPKNGNDIGIIVAWQARTNCVLSLLYQAHEFLVRKAKMNRSCPN
jgi:hypothetical protein